MIVTDDPQTGGASNLTRYMGRDGHSVRGPSGRELDDDELEQFNAKSDDYGFTRHFILAPDRSDYTEAELDRATRRTMNEFTADHDTTQWVYSVHRDDDKERPDVHVAATATKESGDLWFDDNEPIRRLRDDIAADHFEDHSLDQQQEQMRVQGRDEELDREQEPTVDLGGDDDDLGVIDGLKIAKAAVEDQQKRARENKRQQQQKQRKR